MAALSFASATAEFFAASAQSAASLVALFFASETSAFALSRADSNSTSAFTVCSMAEVKGNFFVCLGFM
jgi:hypothetical protein